MKIFKITIGNNYDVWLQASASIEEVLTKAKSKIEKGDSYLKTKRITCVQEIGELQK